MINLYFNICQWYYEPVYKLASTYKLQNISLQSSEKSCGTRHNRKSLRKYSTDFAYRI